MWVPQILFVFLQAYTTSQSTSFFVPKCSSFFSTQPTSSTTEAFKIPCAILPQKVTLLNLCKHFLEIASFFSVYFHCFDLSTSIQSMLFPTLFSLFLIFTKEMTLEARLPRLNVIYYSKVMSGNSFHRLG